MSTFLKTAGLDWRILLGVTVVASMLVVRYLSGRRIPKGLHLPPGPPGILFFGNVFDIPTHHEWVTYGQWAKTYGDLVHLKILNTHIITVNSAEIAHDLFDKRSSLYSDRFHSPMVNDLMGSEWVTTFMHYGEKWRQHRRAFNERFRSAAAVDYHDMQTKQTRNFLRKLLESPEKFKPHLRHLSGAIIMEMVYGIKVLPKGDPYVETAQAAARAWTEAVVPGSFLVDTFPILKYVPTWMLGAGFQRKARAWRALITRMHVAPFDVAKRRFDAGTAQPCFVTSLLDDLSTRSDGSPDEEEVIEHAAGTAYAAGADTTVSAVETFFLAMILYPEVQRKAQNELDTVIGMDRLPDFEDQEDLPYVNALCKEILRWHPVVPLGVPHRVMRDDVYGNLFIPGGSIVIGNSWAILRDEKIFGPEPDKFIPERFLRPEARDPIATFGFGRRICPGRYVAEKSVYIAVASILKVFNITHARDSHGNEIAVEDDVTSGFLSHPKPFKCSIEPRFPSAENLLFKHSI